MPKSLALCLFVGVALQAFSLGAVATADEAAAVAKRPYVIDDLFHADGFGSPVVAPNGKYAVCVRSWIDTAMKQQRHSLWLVEDDRESAKPVEQGQPDARAPILSPDGKWIVFLSTRPRKKGWKQTPATPPQSEPALDLWLIPTAGGDAIPLAGPDKPYGRVLADSFYGNVAFTPDGSRVVFVADDGEDPRTPAEIAADVYVVRPDQGEGYTGFGPSEIWVAHLQNNTDEFAAGRIDRLTNDAFWYGDPQWSADGETIVVHANRTADQESVRYSINKNYDLWEITVADSSKSRATFRQLTFGPGAEVSPRFSPDGTQIACLTVPRKGPHKDVFNLAIVQPGDKCTTEVVFDHRAPSVDYHTHPSPLFPLPRDCWDSDRHVIYLAHSGLDSRTLQADIMDRKVRDLDADNSDYRKRRQWAAEFRPPNRNSLPQRLSAASRVVRWKNDKRQDIEGVLITPDPDIARPPYKLIVNPHGGPHHRSSRGIGFNDQVFASRGYAVFKPNFRGSKGYTLEFLDADRHDFGGGDMRDILVGIEKLVGDGLVDRSQQYVYGVSYGGYMTTWLVGQTDQFRAAVAQNAVTDLTMMWGLSDLQSWTEWEFGGRPWEVPGAMRRHSPLTHVGKVTTPTLILHSREDRRCPIAMGRAYYQSLSARGVPTQMVIYPDEGHGIRQPRHRADVLRRVLNWFDRHSNSPDEEVRRSD
ncbi:MAG TPA: S9 family peptidase [Pirellulaceae bacterium]|nr:S9 family peptidase [Pirellulaceae bacterium]